LFDHLFGTRGQRRRHLDAECLCGLEVDCEVIFGRHLHRQIGQPLAFEDAIHVAGFTLALIDGIRPVRDQAAAI